VTAYDGTAVVPFLFFSPRGVVPRICFSISKMRYVFESSNIHYGAVAFDQT
jgi:hypothetical protein